MKKTFKIVVIALVAVGVIAAVRWYQHEKPIAEGYACNNNLRLLDSAKEQAASQLHLEAGAIVPEAQVLMFCKDRVMPTCPAGGRYSLNPLGKNPTCSLASDIDHPCQLP